jgi:hypothetical protein
MKISRKIIGFAVATALFATQFTVAFASDATAGDLGNGSTTDPNAVVVSAGNEGKGNILINSVDKVVVPTALRFVLNPKSYEVIVRYNEVADPSQNASSGVNYYVKNTTTNKYELLDTVTTDPISDAKPTGFPAGYDGKYYAVTVKNGSTYVDTSEAQVISLNYGIMNKSTADKIVTASFKVSYSDKGSGTPVTFVDNATKATYGNAAGNAGKNDLKMFLQVQTPATGQAVKVRQTYTRATTAAPTFAPTNVYYTYTKTGGTPSGYKLIQNSDATGIATTSGKDGQFDAVADLANAIKLLNGDVFVLEAYNNAGMATTPDTTGAQLSDAVLTGFVTAGDSPQTFVEPTAGASATDTADASVTYELAQGTYVNRPGKLPDYNSQDLGDDIMYCSAANGVTGFTFTGVMNAQVDWAKANTTALKITPRYTIRDLADGEATEAVGDATNGTGLNQVVVAKKPTAVATQNTIDVTSSPKTAYVDVDMGSGSLKATSVTSFKNKKGNAEWISAVTYANGRITFNKESDVQYLADNADSRTFVITFDEGTELEVTLGIKP